MSMITSSSVASGSSGSLANEKKRQKESGNNESSSTPGAVQMQSSLMSSFLQSQPSNSNENESATNEADNVNRNNLQRPYNSNVEQLPAPQRMKARQAALAEAELVLSAITTASSTSTNSSKKKKNTSTSASANANANANARRNNQSQNANSLENFNLLGVVTSPRILEQIAASVSSSSHAHDHQHYINNSSSHQSQSQTNHNNNTDNNSSTNTNNPNFLDPTFFSSMSAMTSTLSKEIESLNSTLYSYSKSYLGTFPSSTNTGEAASAGNLDFETELNAINASGGGYGYNYNSSSNSNRNYNNTIGGGGGKNKGSSSSSTGSGSAMTMNMSSMYPYMFGEDMIKGQIANEDLPVEILDTLDLSSVEAYIRKCGGMAERLKLRDGGKEDMNDDEEDDDNGHDNHDGDDIGKGLDSNSNEEELDDPLQSVPQIFFSEYFDLTDPETFSSLLVLPDNCNDDDNANTGTEDDLYYMDDLKSDENDGIIQIQNPSQFTQHLDTIELALLHQVRSKSSSFFRETNRFTYLKSLVATSVRDVQSLRRELDTIRERSILDAEMVPVMDKRRKDTMILKRVLEEIEHVVEVKASVGNLIQSGDYLGAVERIHLARRLLDGEGVDGDGNGIDSGDGSGDSDGDGDGEKKERHVVLRKITAMNKIHDQLAQYENLVVMDLSNELVESFLSWNGSSNGELLTSMSSSNSSIASASKVKYTILAMKKCGKLSTMADIYREKLCDTIRVTIKTTVSECAADAAKDSSLTPNASGTIVSIPEKGNDSNDDTGAGSSKSSIIEGVTSMSFDQFMECLDMIYDHVLSLLKSAAGVNKFCLEEGISFKDEDALDKRSGDDGSNSRDNANVSTSSSSFPSALSAGADLSHRSISELLRLRKDTHSLITFEEMRRLWDSCLAFTLQLERISGQKAYVLRSTLLAQAKAFVERKHEANMSSLAAALDTERWMQCDVSAERQTVLDRLCSGRAVLSTKNTMTYGDEQSEKQPVATVEGKRYRVVWSCLLLVEMIMSNVACAAHFQTLATNVVGKVSELLRLFNSRATQLVLGAGAIHSSARLKSINAKHLALVTQCVGVVQSILPHIRAALMAQLPSKQQPLLADLDKIKKEYAEHHDKVLEKFVSIIGGILEHSLTPRVGMTNFDERCKLTDGSAVCCPFLDGIITNTMKMHQVLFSLLPQEDLMDVFSRIFAHLDSKVPNIFVALESDGSIPFSFPETTEGKRQMILEVETMSNILNALPDVRPWDFGAMQFLSRRLGMNFAEGEPQNNTNDIESATVEEINLNHVKIDNNDGDQSFTVVADEDINVVDGTGDNADATGGDTQVKCNPNGEYSDEGTKEPNAKPDLGHVKIDNNDGDQSFAAVVDEDIHASTKHVEVGTDDNADVNGGNTEVECNSNGENSDEGTKEPNVEPGIDQFL